MCKKMGKGAITLVDENKNKTFVEDKNGEMLNKSVTNRNRGEKLYRSIGGAKRLTAACIKSIQGHNGAAIRGNHNGGDMKAAIWATFSHKSSDHF